MTSRARLARVLPTLTLAAVIGSSQAGAAADQPLATYTLSPGWATFGLALPQGAAPKAVQVGTVPTQTDVKVRWPDDSIRFAVVSANLGAKSGSYAITPSQPTPGTFVPVLPKVTVNFKIGNMPLTATLPAALNDAWLRGPLVSEGRAVVAPSNHPFLRVIFDVRSYASGGHRIDITVENCLDVANADELTYDVAISVAGANVFTKAGVNHKYLARWRKVFVTGGLQESSVTPDFAPFVAARALPAYLPTVASPARSIKTPEFGLLGFGTLMRPMNAHGGRPEIAPYPDWTAQYLVNRKPDQRAYMLRHGELAGSWGVHVRDADGTMPTIDKYPYYWLDPRWRNETPLQGPRSVRRDPRGQLRHPGDGRAGRQRAPAVACVRAVSRHRRSLLRRRDRLLGELLPDRLLRQRLQPQGPAGSAHRQRGARHRLGAPQPRRRRRVPARQRSDEAVSRRQGGEQPERPRGLRADVQVGPAADAVSRPPAGGRDRAVSALHVDLAVGADLRCVGRRPRDAARPGLAGAQLRQRGQDAPQPHRPPAAESLHQPAVVARSRTAGAVSARRRHVEQGAAQHRHATSRPSRR